MSENKVDGERLRDVAPFGLRMLPDLKERVREAAERNGRSMNAEIVSLLESALGGDDRLNRLEASVAFLLDHFADSA